MPVNKANEALRSGRGDSPVMGVLAVLWGSIRAGNVRIGTALDETSLLYPLQ